MKRFFDALFSFVFLIILSPLFLIISIAIKLTSKGPIYFKQRRIGKDNREFILYKFRTMKIGTPDVATELLKDSKKYITKVGKFLRQSSLDELPQLLNILIGDMSFIGPRPALYNQYDLTEARTKVGVHKLRPGLSGWAQVNGRDMLTVEQKVNYDVYYLKHISVLFDIKIVFRTILKVLRADGVIEGGIKRSANLNKSTYDEPVTKKVSL
jgi:Sugar transferases involved in lipopolysaccharide synthesis